MPVSKALTSSVSDHWCTPQNVIDVVREFGDIVLDPCTNPNSIVGAVNSYSSEDNGIDWTWPLDGLVFVNPPYSDVGSWINKCAGESFHGCEIIALVPARTDTRWFQLCWRADAICFWRGRIRFLGAPASAPFPSAIVAWTQRRARFARIFSRVGHVVLP